MLLINEKKLSALLRKVKVVAIIGASDKPGRPVDMVGRYLIEAGFKVIPVHPKRITIWDLKTYKSITDVPEHIDLVNLFRASQFCAVHAKECSRLEPSPSIFWMQKNIYSSEARKILSPQKITIIENRCLMVDHKNFIGEIA